MFARACEKMQENARRRTLVNSREICIAWSFKRKEELQKKCMCIGADVKRCRGRLQR